MKININKKEFFKRFNEIIPGEFILSESIGNIPSDIYFERMDMSGLLEMHRYSVDERLYEFFEFEPFTTLDETKAYLEKLLQRMEGAYEEKTSMYWFIRRISDNYLVGTAGLLNLNYNRKSIEWGYGVDPTLWGYGYILQIQEILKQYVFMVLELNRLDGVTMINNVRTISSLLAAGMKWEGTLRQFYCKDGTFYDGWKYSMLRQEYIDQTNYYNKNLYQYTTKDVINIISTVLEDDEITEESNMFNTERWDSLNHMAIMAALYDKTKINLSPIQIAAATSVHSITKLINGKLKLA